MNSVRRPETEFLSEGLYFRGNSTETRLGIVLFAVGRGYEVNTYIEDQMLPGAALPVLSGLARMDFDSDLSGEVGSAAAWLTLEQCDADHVFGYVEEFGGWGVWPI